MNKATNTAEVGTILHCGRYNFLVVDEPPVGYEIWNIGTHMPDGWLPFCRLKTDQPFPGGRTIETDTLKVMRVAGAQTILTVAGYGPQTSAEMEKFIQENEADQPSLCTRMKAAIPYLKAIGL